ncbi:MAG: TolC family protein [Acidobacteria bacterium]|nr:TolC family protein [Acidobacteriota bacterium]
MQTVKGRKFKKFHMVGVAALPALCMTAPCAHAQISLSEASELALRNSPAVRMSIADVRHAQGALGEARDAYVPNLSFGSSIGYSYGFPLGEPSIYDVQAHSLVFSFSQRDYIRSARKAVHSAEMSLRDTREKVLAETAEDYIELNTDLKEIVALDQQKSYADALTGIERQRVQAGIDPRSTMLQAELTSAQIVLRRVHIQQDAALMRSQLAHLTGLKPGDFQPTASSIPPMPDLKSATAEDLRIAGNNPLVAAAKANAQSKLFLSMGDKRQIRRPTFGFGMQYSRFAQFNNYAEYYQHFQQNNFGIAININVPIFDASGRAKAEQSAADAVHAQAQVQQALDKVDENILKLRQSLTELRAQQRVAQIQSELAQSQLATVEQELKSGSGQPNANPITPQQAEQAHIQERERYIDMLKANLDVSRAELNLLRLTGGIESWLHSAPQK